MKRRSQQLAEREGNKDRDQRTKKRQGSARRNEERTRVELE